MLRDCAIDNYVCGMLRKSRLRREHLIWKKKQILYLLKKQQVFRQKKLMRAYRRCRLVRGSLPLLDTAATCDFSLDQPWQ